MWKVSVAKQFMNKSRWSYSTVFLFMSLLVHRFDVLAIAMQRDKKSNFAYFETSYKECYKDVSTCMWFFLLAWHCGPFLHAMNVHCVSYLVMADIVKPGLTPESRMEGAKK